MVFLFFNDLLQFLPFMLKLLLLVSQLGLINLDLLIELLHLFGLLAGIDVIGEGGLATLFNLGLTIFKTLF